MELTTERQLNYFADDRHPLDHNTRRMAKEIIYLRGVVDALINSGVDVRDSLALNVCELDILLDSYNHVAHRK